MVVREVQVGIGAITGLTALSLAGSLKLSFIKFSFQHFKDETDIVHLSKKIF